MRPRMSRIFWRGKYLDYPLQAAPTSSRSSARSSSSRCTAVLPVGRDQAQGPRGQPRAVGLQPLRQAPLQALLQVLHREGVGRARPPRSAPSGPPSASRACRFFSAAKAAFFGNKGNKIKSLIGEFQYPRYGPGQMWEQMTDPHRGARRRGAAGDAGDAHRDRVDGEVVAVHTPRRGHRAAGRRSRRCRCARPSASPTRAARSRVREAAKGLRYRDFLTVALVLDGEDLFPDNWIYIHEPRRPRRPHPELPLVEPVDGPRPRHRLRRPRVLLLQGRRAVDAWTTTTSSRSPRASSSSSASPGPSRSAAATSCASRRPIRCTTRTTPSASRRSASGWTRWARTSSRSAATGCTATTTPTTRC